MTYQFLNEEHSNLTCRDAAWQLADHWVTAEEEKYRNDNLLGTDRDVVVDRLADEIMEGFERGNQLDPRIQLSYYEEENL